MKIISFNFTSNEVNYTVLSGTKLAPTLDSKGRLSLPANHNIPQLVSWFERELDLLLNNNAPDKVCYKLTINRVTNNYVSNVYYGQAILNLLCHKKGISTDHVSPVSVKPSKFNQPKDTDLYVFLEGLIGRQNSPWDKAMKDTLLMGLINL